MEFSGQHIPYNRELFAFLSGEQMSIPHGHGGVLMTHELLQFHERHLAGLRQPGGKGMSHGVQGDGVQTVAVFRSQIELSDGGLETGGCFFKRRLLARLLEDGFRMINGIKTSGKKRDNLGSIGKSFRRGCNSIAESATKKEGNQPSFFVGG